MTKRAFKISQVGWGSRRQRASPEETQRRAAVRGTRKLILAVSKLLTLALLGISLGTYVESRPNTGGVSSVGPFDGKRAFADLRQIVGFGPRPSGSQALERCRAFIRSELRRARISVSEDTFTARTPIGPIPMTNIVATIPGTSSLVVIIGGHYDTKRMTTPFVGANDGGSSTACLIELARVLACRKHKLTYWLVFFDGEEALAQWSPTDGLYGSRHFAKRPAEKDAQDQIKALIVIDMIGDSNLDIQRERYSTPWLTDVVFGEARRLGYGRYFLNGTRAIEDDHLPFLELGVPAVDIIDLDYGPFNLYWHSRYDTADKCSPASLAIVARRPCHSRGPRSQPAFPAERCFVMILAVSESLTWLLPNAGPLSRREPRKSQTQAQLSVPSTDATRLDNPTADNSFFPVPAVTPLTSDKSTLSRPRSRPLPLRRLAICACARCHSRLSTLGVGTTVPPSRPQVLRVLRLADCRWDAISI